MNEIDWMKRIRDEVLALETADDFYFGGEKLILMGAREYNAFREYRRSVDYPLLEEVTQPWTLDGTKIIRVAAPSFFEVVPLDETQMYDHYLRTLVSELQELAEGYLDRKKSALVSELKERTETYLDGTEE